MTDFLYELRIPKGRIAVLIGTNGEVKNKIERAAKCELKIDSKEGDVFIKGSDALSLYAVKNIISAIGRGFNPDVALLLLKHDYGYEQLNMDHAVKTKKHLIRMKGRVIGSEGKARRIIEELTDTNVSVYGKTIGIIGDIEAVGIAKKAFASLLSGSPHSTVYAWLERQHARIKRKEATEI